MGEMMSFSRILVPLDGSPAGNSILPSAIALSKKLNAELRIHAVVDHATGQLPAYFVADGGRGVELPSEFDIDFRQLPEWQKITEDRLDKAKGYLADAEKIIQDAGVTVESSTSVGDPTLEINAAAKRVNADLIVLGSSGWSDLPNGLVGSVVERMLQSSTVPMIIFRSGTEAGGFSASGNISQVITGLDGSKLAEQGLEVAASLSRAFGAGLTLVTATETTTRGIDPEVAERFNAGPSDYLGRVAKSISKNGVKASTMVASGPAAQELCRIAHEAGESVIVVTTRGRSGFSRWTLGSITDRVVRTAMCPVIAVPSIKE